MLVTIRGKDKNEVEFSTERIAKLLHMLGYSCTVGDIRKSILFLDWENQIIIHEIKNGKVVMA